MAPSKNQTSQIKIGSYFLLSNPDGSITTPFLWGTATSSHQVEGNNQNNDWWDWEKSGRVPFPSGQSCDHYNLFRRDFEILSSLEHTAHRFSIEWSRVEPAENVWDEKAIAHYVEVIRELRSRGIEPVVTLHHFTNPQWFMSKGGWMRSDAVSYFERYVEKIVNACGREVCYWITFNEPLIYVYEGYLLGVWPPGIKSYKDALKVLRNLLLAHVAAYQKIHGIYATWQQKKARVSISQYTLCLQPCRPGAIQDRLAVFFRHWFVNELFLKAAHTGFLFFPGFFCESLPAKRTLDFIGLNYYTRHFIRFSGFGGEEMIGRMCDDDHHGIKAKRNSMGWEIYPRGLYKALKSLRQYRLPVLITENGICTDRDAQRAEFIKEHIKAVRLAKQEGVPVLGYLYWSLLDNFEWDKGYAPKFGIVEVDPATRERKIKSSAHVLTDSCRKL